MLGLSYTKPKNVKYTAAITEECSCLQLPIKPQIFLSSPRSFYCWVLWGLLKLDQSSYPLREDRGDWISPCFLSWPERGRWFGQGLPRKCDSLHTTRPKASDFPSKVAATVTVEAPARQTALPDTLSTTCLPSVPTLSIPPAWTTALPRHAENYQSLVKSVLFVCFSLQRRTLLNFPSPTHINPGWPVRAKGRFTVIFSCAFWIPATSTWPAKAKRPAQYQADGVLWNTLKVQRSRESLDVVQ